MDRTEQVRQVYLLCLPPRPPKPPEPVPASDFERVAYLPVELDPIDQFMERFREARAKLKAKYPDGIQYIHPSLNGKLCVFVRYVEHERQQRMEAERLKAQATYQAYMDKYGNPMSKTLDEMLEVIRCFGEGKRYECE